MEQSAVTSAGRENRSLAIAPPFLAVVDKHREDQEVASLEQALETERDPEKQRQIMRRLHDIHVERQQRRSV